MSLRILSLCLESGFAWALPPCAPGIYANGLFLCVCFETLGEHVYFMQHILHTICSHLPLALGFPIMKSKRIVA